MMTVALAWLWRERQTGGHSPDRPEAMQEGGPGGCAVRDGRVSGDVSVHGGEVRCQERQGEQRQAERRQRGSVGGAGEVQQSGGDERR